MRAFIDSLSEEDRRWIMEVEADDRSIYCRFYDEHYMLCSKCPINKALEEFSNFGTCHKALSKLKEEINSIAVEKILLEEQ